MKQYLLSRSWIDETKEMSGYPLGGVHSSQLQVSKSATLSTT